MIKSIKFKITLWYIITLLISLLVFSILIYNNQKKTIDKYTDDILFTKAESLVDEIERYIDDYSEFEEPKDIVEKIIKDDINKLINEHLNKPQTASLSIEILDTNGNRIYNSSNIPSFIKTTDEAIDKAINKEAYYQTLSIKQEGKNIFYRSYTTPIQFKNNTIYILTVFKPLFQNLEMMSDLFSNIIIFMPITLLLTGLLGITIAKIALKPVNNIIKTIKNIDLGTINMRIKVPKTNDEIEVLSKLLNEMLERIENSYIIEKNFIQDASHQLKTPITILKGEIEVALKKQRTEEEYKEILKSNLEEVNKLNMLINDLLILAKLQVKRNIMPNDIIDINEIIEKVYNNLKKLSDTKNINIITKLSEEKLIIKCHKDEITKAIENILENSIKYSFEKSTIEITSLKQDNNAVIIISDNGPGINKDDLPHIFERFYRAKTSYTVEGFGLGLSIAKQAIENSKGTILVQNNPDKGARFIIKLPLFKN